MVFNIRPCGKGSERIVSSPIAASRSPVEPCYDPPDAFITGASHALELATQVAEDANSRVHLDPHVDDGDAVGSWPQVYPSALEKMPIASNDAARCARVTELGLPMMEKHPEIEAIIRMAAELFDVDQVQLTTSDHKCEYPKFIWLRDPVARVAMRTFPNNLIKATSTPFMKGCDMHCLPGTKAVCVNRGAATCNLVLATGQPVVIHNSMEDPLLRNHPGDPMSNYAFYAGVPCRSADGLPLCVLCLRKKTPLPDFSDKDMRQLQKLAGMISKQLVRIEAKHRVAQIDAIKQSTLTHAALTLQQNQAFDPCKCDEVTVVCAELVGLATIDDACPDLVASIFQIYGRSVRRLLSNYRCYEVEHGNDSFLIAFGDACDAARFCLEVQVAIAERSLPDISSTSESNVNPLYTLRKNIEIRMGLHSGKPSRVRRRFTNDMCGGGQPALLARAIANVSHGGQIVASRATWSRIEPFLQELGGPQILDLGEHVLKGRGLADALPDTDGVLPVGLLQLLPACIAPTFDSETQDFSTERCKFPPVSSVRQASPGFNEAPRGLSLTLASVNVCHFHELWATRPDVADEAVELLLQCIRGILRDINRTGIVYNAQGGSVSLAFAGGVDATMFLGRLLRALPQVAWPSSLRLHSLKFAQGLKISCGVLQGCADARLILSASGCAQYEGSDIDRVDNLVALAQPGQSLFAFSQKGPPISPPHFSGLSFVHIGLRTLASREQQSVRVGLYELRVSNTDEYFPGVAEFVQHLKLQSMVEHIERFIDEQGGESLDDIVRYNKREEFLDDLNLKPIPRMKADQYLRALVEAAGAKDGTASQKGSSSTTLSPSSSFRTCAHVSSQSTSNSSVALALENISRMTSEEMQRLYDKLLLETSKLETLVCHFTSRASVDLILGRGSTGLRASKVGQCAGGLSVCKVSPSQVGWEAYGSGEWRPTVGKALYGRKWETVLEGNEHADKLECVLFLRIKKSIVDDMGNLVPGREDCVIIPRHELYEHEDGHHYLSKANVVRVCELTPASS